MVELGECPKCSMDLSGLELTELPDGSHGRACPQCGRDVYCGICGDMTMPL